MVVLTGVQQLDKMKSKLAKVIFVLQGLNSLGDLSLLKSVRVTLLARVAHLLISGVVRGHGRNLKEIILIWQKKCSEGNARRLPQQTHSRSCLKKCKF
jgi:hypothetical protein